MFLLWLILVVLTAMGADEQLHGNWKQTAVLPLKGTLHHVQGIDVDGDKLWVSSVDRRSGKGWLTRFALPAGNLEAQVEVQQGKRIHPGGIALDGQWVWVPVAEYDRDGPTSIERRDRDTLALMASFEVQDHIGCIAAEKGGLIGGNWDSRILYRWSREGKEQSRTPNPTRTAYQDIKRVGEWLLASGNTSREAGAIEFLDPKTLAVGRRITAGKTDRGVSFTNEGMTMRGGRLYLLPEDDPSRLFVFEKQ
jgi:hypothetical protein